MHIGFNWTEGARRATGAGSENGTTKPSKSNRAASPYLWPPDGDRARRVSTRIPTDLQSGGTQVLIERMAAGSSAVSAPAVVSKSTMPVAGNALAIALDWTNAQDGYAITLTLFGARGDDNPVRAVRRLPQPIPACCNKTDLKHGSAGRSSSPMTPGCP